MEKEKWLLIEDITIIENIEKNNKDLENKCIVLEDKILILEKENNNLKKRLDSYYVYFNKLSMDEKIKLLIPREL